MSFIKRYHRISEDPKLRSTKPEQWHHYTELSVVMEALQELLWLTSDTRDREDALNRDKAEVAYKILYRLAEHHKNGEQGRPDYPEFSWGIIDALVQRKAPLFSTLGMGGGPRADAHLSPRQTAPATPQEAEA